MPQTHSRTRDGKRVVWHTERLWELARDLEPFQVEVESFKELDADCWFGSTKSPTLREVARHCRRIHEASLEYPIILNDDGRLMDGGHRLCKALLEGRKTVSAVRFEVMPEPDECHALEDQEP